LTPVAARPGSGISRKVQDSAAFAGAPVATSMMFAPGFPDGEAEETDKPKINRGAGIPTLSTMSTLWSKGVVILTRAIINAVKTK